MPTSASVMVTYQTRSVGDVHELELLVLWRGTPGWFARGGSGSSGGGGSGGGAWSQRFTEGGYSFEITGDSNARTANILGKTIDLSKGNAVLIDGVDAPEGPQIVGTLLVDTRLPDGAGPNRILPLLGRSKDLRE